MKNALGLAFLISLSTFAAVCAHGQSNRELPKVLLKVQISPSINSNDVVENPDSRVGANGFFNIQVSRQFAFRPGNQTGSYYTMALGEIRDPSQIDCANRQLTEFKKAVTNSDMKKFFFGGKITLGSLTIGLIDNSEPHKPLGPNDVEISDEGLNVLLNVSRTMSGSKFVDNNFGVYLTPVYTSAKTCHVFPGAAIVYQIKRATMSASPEAEQAALLKSIDGALKETH